ncbi:MAG TPA: hypothetical protein VD840_05135 [Sinorhizobium sp.]|nr:hypothetical protein [Sinorhizobium sp.]
MDNVVVIGLPGETGLWLVDLANRTIEPLDRVTGDLAILNGYRKPGSAFVKNVDFAIAVSSVDEVFAGHVDS